MLRIRGLTMRYPHGKLALAVGLTKCTTCHGTDFAGGAAKVSCLDCHKQGPTACDTCHGQPPQTGAHPHAKAAGAGR